MALCKCTYMCMHTHSCGYMWVCTCHSMGVEVSRQPCVLVLTVYLFFVSRHGFSVKSWLSWNLTLFIRLALISEIHLSPSLPTATKDMSHHVKPYLPPRFFLPPGWLVFELPATDSCVCVSSPQTLQMLLPHLWLLGESSGFSAANTFTY